MNSQRRLLSDTRHRDNRIDGRLTASQIASVVSD
jgi:hypothetical protein